MKAVQTKLIVLIVQTNQWMDIHFSINMSNAYKCCRFLHILSINVSLKDYDRAINIEDIPGIDDGYLR